MSDSIDPANVVQKQLDAYNKRDIDALLSTYTDDAQLFEHPSTLLANGAAELRPRFIARFNEPNLHAVLLSQMVLGNIVVDHEQVTRTFVEGPGTIKLIMIYEVRGERIATAWIISGEKSLET